jgi:large subunit ribosomal protein L9
MRLILTQEVAGLGEAGDVVEVKDGYGRNYLVPRGLGIRWTKGGETHVATLRKSHERRVIADLDTAHDVRTRLEGTHVTLSARAGEAGRLFGAITPTDIVTAITKAGGPQVDKRRVEVPNPIKTVGTHTVTVRLHPDVVASVRIDVVPA